MNRRSTYHALAAIFFIAGGCTNSHAQSNVTIYGLLNLGVVKESKTPTRVDRGYLNWLGFTGSEDLGNGLSATFNLMTRFAPNTGAQESSVFWHGESTVGLKSTTFGTLRLGRGLTPLFAYKYQFEPWGDSWLMGSVGKYQSGGRFFSNPPACLSDCPGFARLNNGVFYDSPGMGGFRFSVASQAQIETNAQKRGLGFSVNYADGPISAMLAGENNTVHDKAAFFAAKYDFGTAALMGSYNENSVPNTPKERNFIIAGTYVIGGPNSLRAAVGKNTTLGDHKVSGGYVYTFSKRTLVYGDVYREKTATAINGLAFGMQHSF